MKKVKYVLRPLEERDLELRVEWMNNPRINSTMSFELPITIEGTRKWFEKVSKQTNCYDFCLERDSEVVAVTASGKKLSETGYIDYLNKISESIKNGEKTYTSEEVKAFVLNRG